MRAHRSGKGSSPPSPPDVDGREPGILFLEGATAHVNSATKHINQLALAGLLGQVTVIAAAHRLPTHRAAGYILVLIYGLFMGRTVMTCCWRFLKESASACTYCSSWNTSSENSASLQRAIH